MTDEHNTSKEPLQAATGASPSGYLSTILVLATISALASMAIHILAPVLPLIQTDLETSVSGVQLIVAVYMGALGTAQLLAGPLVDRWGRMPMLYTGLALYSAGSIGSMMAPGLEILVLSRVLQGIGGAAAVVSTRVLVSDIFGQEGGARHQAALLSVVLISPAFAPTVGAFVAGLAGWRAVPAVLALIATLSIFFAMRRISPQAAAHRHPAGQKVSALAGIVRLWRNPVFLASAGVLSFSSGGLYIFLASAPFVLQNIYGLTEEETGLVFMATAVAAFVGTRLAGWIDRQTDAMLAGCCVALLGTGTLVILAMFGLANPAWIVACISLLGIGGGIAGPATINNSIAAVPGLAGTGASMLGATQMLVSGAATIPLGLLAPITVLELALGVCLATILALLSALILKLER